MTIAITKEHIEQANKTDQNPVEIALKANLVKRMSDPYLTVRVSKGSIVIGSGVYTRVPQEVKQILTKFEKGHTVRPTELELTLTKAR